VGDKIRRLQGLARHLAPQVPGAESEAAARAALLSKADLVSEMGYHAPVAAADLLNSHLPSKNSCILDAGCGTGLVGEALYRLGHRDLVGLDYSADMLERARHKKVYQRLTQGDLTRPLGIDDGTYDAVICVGTLTLGHVGPQAVPELVRITRPGGLICFTVRDQAWVVDDYPAVMECLQQNRTATVEHQVIPYIEEDNSSCHLCLLRVV